MWRLSVLVLAVIVASCAGPSEKERIAEKELAAQKEREEALRGIEDLERERTQASTQLEDIRKQIGETQQKLAEEKALIEKYKTDRESIQSKLSALGKEQKEANALLEGKKPQSAGEEDIAKYFQDAQFVVHGGVVTFGTSGMDGSLVKIKFHISEVLKGGFTGADVEFEELPPGASSKVKPLDLFRSHGNDYIICFKKGAEEGKYEYCGPNLNSPEIIANEANLKKVKETYLKTSPPGSEK
jgi:hypothetical protein